MKIIFLNLFILCCINSYGQELIEMYGSLMEKTDSISINYLSTEEQVVKEEKYYDKDGELACIIGYDKDSLICHYQTTGMYHDRKEYGLRQATWKDEKLVLFDLFGPNLYMKFWSIDTSFTETYYKTDELGNGYGMKIDKNQNLIKKDILSDSLHMNTSEYYANGKLKKIRTIQWSLGIHVGKYEEFDESGNLKVAGNYLSISELDSYGIDKKDIEHGIKHGSWNYYADGVLERTEKWHSGNQIK